jgi:putative FmdB family regulatory protein
MPIYAYRCTSCGHAKDVLQKMSDPLLSVCPACGASTFAKQLTAAGFQLKGSGWYVTDFRNADGKKGNGKPAEDKPADATTGSAEADKPADSAKPAEGASAKASSTPAAASAPAPAASADS